MKWSPWIAALVLASIACMVSCNGSQEPRAASETANIPHREARGKPPASAEARQEPPPSAEAPQEPPPSAEAPQEPPPSAETQQQPSRNVAAIATLDDASDSGVAQAVRRSAGAIRGCYERALKVNPDVEGKVVVRFTVGEDGRVTEAVIGSDTTGAPSIGECIRTRALRWRFDATNGNRTYTYPFIFKRSG